MLSRTQPAVVVELRVERYAIKGVEGGNNRGIEVKKGKKTKFGPELKKCVFRLRLGLRK